MVKIKRLTKFYYAYNLVSTDSIHLCVIFRITWAIDESTRESLAK